MNAVSVDAVTVRAGKRKILDGLSCAVRENDFLVVIGPNGAGKTTLLKTLCGLAHVAEGGVTILGRPLPAYSRRGLAATVALVPQQVSLEFSFSVEQTVLMGRFPHLGLLEREKQRDYEAARRAMRFTEVDHLAGRRLDQLSGGERQRVMIARAICQQPRIMLLDEPTAALDPAHQVLIMQLMQRLRKEEGVTVVMVSHDLNLAAMFGSRILLVKDGREVTGGSPAEIMTAENLRQAYGCPMHVDFHPLTGTPRISILPFDPIRQAEEDEAMAQQPPSLS
ncbi:MAG: ABC transporter ATP-binding protein [Desulfobulbaceae bacterium]|jgi:iron complex transport system ATP-binding protein|nr:ABC transporter ATP-binding protein [Desulfobulbaceae bacterium]MDY0350602.1 ABC transporter ATP-binding protein [Desulfobulbaceae bacterium]